MKNINEYLESGILEKYVLGFTTEEENAEIEKLSNEHESIRTEIDEISEALVCYAQKNVTVNPTIKPMVMAVIDYTERLAKGEKPGFPPVLTEETKISDFSQWLERKDMVLPDDFTDFHASIIGMDPEKTTAITWLKYGSPPETHTDEYEKFLILEGTCDIKIDGKVFSLVPGDYLAIPLHVTHDVMVTSSIPCKVILQRIAA
jgi:mannose-6-phosphate isomerase-like protein (cupin superfamily)